MRNALKFTFKANILLTVLLALPLLTSCGNRSDKPVSTAYTSTYVKPAKGDVVYITPTGKCYHRADCFTIRRSKKQAVSRSNAEAMGKTACKKCHPNSLIKH